MEFLENRSNLFEKRIKPLLRYIGTIGAVLMSIAYIIIIIIFILGFHQNMNFVENVIFAVINAIIGMIIMQLLKIQGIDFAKDIPENKAILTEYYNTNTKDRKYHSIKFYWVSSVLKDVLIKGLSFAISTVGLIYIAIEGNGDFNLILLAIVNLVMFICFGFLSLVNAYDYFNDQHIPYIKNKLKETNEYVRNKKEQSDDRTPQSSRTSTEE